MEDILSELSPTSTHDSIYVEEELPQFPLEALPPPLANYVSTVADAMAAPLAFSAASIFPVIAVGVGEHRSLIVNADSNWIEPALVFVALVGDTGQSKSPVLEEMVAPLNALDQEARQAYEIEQDAYHKLSKSERDKLSMQVPRMKPWIRTDVTIERLSIDLKNHRAILAYYDELTEWVRGMKGKYSGGDSNRAKWLQLFGGRRMDRARVGDGTNDIDICILNPRVSLLGGIQPMFLYELAAMRDGMEFRLLYALGDEDPRKKRKGRIEDRAWYHSLVRHLSRLTDGDMHLTAEGLAVLDAFGDEMLDQGCDPGLVKKLTTYVGRLTLLLSLVWMYYEGADREPTAIDVERACSVVRWFAAHHNACSADLHSMPNEVRMTRLSLEKLKDYLARSCRSSSERRVPRRKVLQAKIPGIISTEQLRQAMATLEAMEIAREVTHDKKQWIEWLSD